MEIPLDNIQFIMDKLEVLNADYTQLAIDVAVLKSQVAELLWLVKLVGAAFIGLIISQIWQLLKMRNNSKK